MRTGFHLSIPDGLAYVPRKVRNLLALVWVAIAAPGSPAGVDPAAFETVLGLSTNIVIDSLAAYIVR